MKNIKLINKNSINSTTNERAETYIHNKYQSIWHIERNELIFPYHMMIISLLLFSNIKGWGARALIPAT